MTTVHRTRAIALALLLALCITFLPPGLGGTVPVQAAGSVSLTTFGTAYTQDFNTLANSGTSNTAVPTGWEFSESGTNANTTYRAGTGSDNTGDTYSFGATGNSERAFGGLRSGTLVPLIGAQFTNNTGGTITSLAVAYTGEQWRLGQNTTGRAADRLDFQLSTNATSLTTGTWTDYDSLDFCQPGRGRHGRGAQRQCLAQPDGSFIHDLGLEHRQRHHLLAALGRLRPESRRRRRPVGRRLFADAAERDRHRHSADRGKYRAGKRQHGCSGDKRHNASHSANP